MSEYRRICKKVFSEVGLMLLTGLMFILAGVVVVMTGRIRSIIVLGEAKYLVGAALIACGVWIAWYAIREIMRRLDN